MQTDAAVRTEPNTTPGSQVTADLDTLTGAPWRSGFTYSLLGSGPVRAEVSTADFADVGLRTLSTNRSVSCRGSVGKGLGFLELWPERARKIAVNGRSMAPGQVFLSVGDDAVDVTSVGPSDSVALTFRLARVSSALSVDAIDLLTGDSTRRGLIDVASRRGAARELLARSIVRCAMSKPEQLDSDQVESFICDVIEESARVNCSVPAAALSASRIVREALNVMLSNLSEPLDLKDVAAVCCVSQRTLIYQFNDVVGITPMAYYKLQRLNAVRRSLKIADIRMSRVIDVAAAFGFYHMGHFAADFRELFGTLPSEIIGVGRTHRRAFHT
jgi:AraC-like DNA-binding protein